MSIDKALDAYTHSLIRLKEAELQKAFIEEPNRDTYVKLIRHREFMGHKGVSLNVVHN